MEKDELYKTRRFFDCSDFWKIGILGKLGRGEGEVWDVYYAVAPSLS